MIVRQVLVTMVSSDLSVAIEALGETAFIFKGVSLRRHLAVEQVAAEV